MTWEKLQTAAEDFLRGCAENYITEADALRPDLTGLRIYDAPLWGVAAAEDPIVL